jgi:two-component system, response regulator PdtaR
MVAAKILVVEDEFIIAKALQVSLNALGYDVIARVSTGEEALAVAVQKQPDLVLMDIKLKGALDGVQAAQRIQTVLHIPVVYLTAHSDPATLQRVVYSHPYGFLTKPFTEEGLKQTIGQAIARHQTLHDPATRTPPSV